MINLELILNNQSIFLFQDEANAISYVATSNDTNTISGGYFLHYKLSKWPESIEDKNLGSKLWEKSSELVELDQNISMEYILQIIPTMRESYHREALSLKLI